MFFFAGMVSLMGQWIQNIAMGWLVYRLTDSAFYLGLVGFIGQIPALFLTPVAGVYADRLNRQRVLIFTQSLPMMLSFLLAFLIYTDKITVELILMIVSLNGLALAFDNPFRHAFLLDMVGDKKLLTNAIALNSTLVNTARFIGPTLGGFLIALYGEALSFLINGLSFLGVIIALASMKVVPLPKKETKKSLFADLREGFQYTYNFIPARYMIFLIMSTSLLGLPFQGFLPVFARDVFAGDSQLLGFLTGAVGAGALTGAFYLASRESINKMPDIIRTSALLFAVGLGIFSLLKVSWIAFLVLYFTGFGMITQFVATNTILQTVVADDKKGRVISFYSMSFMGFTPIGSLLLGSLAKWVGVPLTFSIAAIILLATALFYSSKLPSIKKTLFP